MQSMEVTDSPGTSNTQQSGEPPQQTCSTTPESHEESPPEQNPSKIPPKHLPKTVPKKQQDFSYKLKGETETRKATCLGRAGKASTASWHYINIYDHDSKAEKCVSVKDDIDSWTPIPAEQNTLVTEKNDQYSKPKESELSKWREMNVYTEVPDEGQKRMGTRWVCNERLKGGKIEAKARLCARGCEDLENVPTDSPTCERDNVRLLLSIAACLGWDIHSIDFKSAYLQGEDLNRDIFLTPPKEANTEKLWKLNKCVYGINDAGKKWYNQLRGSLVEMGMKVSSLDQAVFFKHKHGKLSGLLVLHVDDTLWTGDESFSGNEIEKLKQAFLVSAEEHNKLKYLGLSIVCDKQNYTMNLNDYTNGLRETHIDPTGNDDDCLNDEELKQLRIMSGKINWLSTQCRPDLSYNACQMACSVKSGKKKDLKLANKILRRAKGIEYNLNFSALGDITNWKIICFSDASWGQPSRWRLSGGPHRVYLR